MKKSILWFVAFLPLGLMASPNRERTLYVGSNSTEAKMSFAFEVVINSNTAPSRETILEKIENQVVHLFGPMGEAEVRAVPKGDHKISKVSRPTLMEGTPKAYVVNYQYDGTIVLMNGPKKFYDVILPYNPDTIYESSGLVGGKNPCTDDHYNSEGDFWYFWNPENPNCKLEKGVDYAVIKTSITRLPNTRKSYPEYSRLVREVEGKKQITVSVLLGMDETSKGRNPLNSGDTNAHTYVAMRNSLLKMGFKLKGEAWTKKELDQYLGYTTDTPHFVEEFIYHTPKADIMVRMSFGPSGIDEESDGFHYLLKDAIENSSIMVYDGHSGLGGHLDLDSIEETEGFRIGFSKDYQIYFFNSCSSYTYYNTQYFARKAKATRRKASKDLDILTNGLATYFTVMHDTNVVLVRAIVDWGMNRASTSYQVLAKEIDSENLFGVNGDEDNPTSPR